MEHVFLFSIKKVDKNKFWLRELKTCPTAPPNPQRSRLVSVVTGFGIPVGVQALNMQFSHLHGVPICINRTAASWKGYGRFAAVSDPNVGYALAMQPGTE